MWCGVLLELHDCSWVCWVRSGTTFGLRLDCCCCSYHVCVSCPSQFVRFIKSMLANKTLALFVTSQSAVAATVDEAPFYKATKEVYFFEISLRFGRYHHPSAPFASRCRPLPPCRSPWSRHCCTAPMASGWFLDVVFPLLAVHCFPFRLPAILPYSSPFLPSFLPSFPPSFLPFFGPACFRQSTWVDLVGPDWIGPNWMGRPVVRFEPRAFMFHENYQDEAELLVNAKLLPELSDGGYVEIWKHSKHATDPPHEQRVVLRVGSTDSTQYTDTGDSG